MWKKLIVGAVIVVALITAVAVSYVRAVIGSYHIDLLLDGKVIGSGEFTIRMETFEPSGDLKYQGVYSATGTLQVGKPIKDFVLSIASEQPIIGDQVAIKEFYIEPTGVVALQLANSWPDSYFMIDIANIRGRTAQGKFGYVGNGNGGDFCQCTVTRK